MRESIKGLISKKGTVPNPFPTTIERPPIFSWQILKKNYSLFPLLAVMSFAVSMAGGYLTYSALTKSDVNWIRTSGSAPRHDRLDPYTYRFKLYTIKQKHMPDAQREELLKEIGSYKY